MKRVFKDGLVMSMIFLSVSLGAGVSSETYSTEKAIFYILFIVLNFSMYKVIDCKEDD